MPLAPSTRPGEDISLDAFQTNRTRRRSPITSGSWLLRMLLKTLDPDSRQAHLGERVSVPLCTIDGNDPCRDEDRIRLEVISLHRSPAIPSVAMPGTATAACPRSGEEDKHHELHRRTCPAALAATRLSRGLARPPSTLSLSAKALPYFAPHGVVTAEAYARLGRGFRRGRPSSGS